MGDGPGQAVWLTMGVMTCYCVGAGKSCCCFTWGITMSESRNYRVCLLAKLAEGDVERERLEAMARAFAGNNLFKRELTEEEATFLALGTSRHTQVDLIACEAIA